MLAGTLGEVIAGVGRGRTDDQEITASSTHRTDHQDMAVDTSSRRAIVEGIGKEFDMFQGAAGSSDSTRQKVAARMQ